MASANYKNKNINSVPGINYNIKNRINKVFSVNVVLGINVNFYQYIKKMYLQVSIFCIKWLLATFG